MNYQQQVTSRLPSKPNWQCVLSSTGSILLSSLVFIPVAYSLDFDVGNEDVKMRWDNTVKYSAGMRLKEPSSTLTQDANLDDGDRNFKKGRLFSNRFDILSEFDISYKDVGARVSGAAWYDSVYNRSNNNDSPATANSASVSHDQFTDETRDLHGREAEILDAFVYGKASMGDMSFTGRAGKHTVLYGESLYFGNNGIAAAQSPIDYVKLLSVPGTQFKELVHPVPQLSGQVQLTPNLAIGAYYQLAWERDRLPAAGSYFSTLDFLDDGGERILAGPNPFIPGGPTLFLNRAKDIKASDSGQGGIQIRYRPEGQDTDYGFYAAQYHYKDPILYVHPGVGFNPTTGQVGTYQLVFPEKISTVGASFSTVVGDTNVAGEMSVRHNMPLVPKGGSVTVPTGVVADNDSHPLYPVGNTLHGQLSWIALLSPSSLWDGGSFLGEFAWNRRLNVTRNAEALDPEATRDAGAIRMTFEPAYYQVLPGLDIKIPVGVGYGLFGKSSVLHPGFGAYHSGDFSVGLNGDYLKVWKFGVNYAHFFGGDDGVVTPSNAAGQHYSYGQSLGDRDFITFTAQRTF